MRLTRSTCRAAVIVAGAAALVAGTVLVTAQAQAATAESVSTLTAKLAGRSPGSYLDPASGKMVVTITDASDATQVRAAGAVPRVVKHTAAQLGTATATLDRAAKVAGTAWSVDPVTNQVLLSVDSTVTGARLAQVQAVAARLGDTVRVEHVAGTFTTRIAGGDAIYGSQYRCSLGFNVVSGGTYYFLTAGHCGNLASTWYSDGGHTNAIGTRVGSTFPGHDYSLFRYTGSTSHPGSVDLYGSSQDIASSANAYVGESVRRSGSTTHVHSGTVTALNATVNYAEGTVTGMIRTNVCAEGGDSGGPLFSGSVAVGLTSGGSGNCSSGGTTFFQPVTGALSAYGVSVF